MTFFFFFIKLFDRVIIGIFSNRLNHWAQIYLKFLKLVLLFRIEIHKVVKNGARHRRFWRKKLHFPLPWFVFILTINWATMAINIYARFQAAELLWIKKKKKLKMLNILKIPAVLAFWDRTGMDNPYIITLRT